MLASLWDRTTRAPVTHTESENCTHRVHTHAEGRMRLPTFVDANHCEERLRPVSPKSRLTLPHVYNQSSQSSLGPPPKYQEHPCSKSLCLQALIFQSRLPS